MAQRNKVNQDLDTHLLFVSMIHSPVWPSHDLLTIRKTHCQVMGLTSMLFLFFGESRTH